MHLFSPEVGMMGTSGIVGPCILQAAGAGYSFKLLKTRPRRRGVLRRRRGEQRRLPRRAEHGGDLEAAGAVRVREQPVRHRGAVRATRPATRAWRRAARPTACPASKSTATTCWRSATRRARRCARPAPAAGRRCSSARPTAPGRTPRAWATSPTAPARRSERWKAKCPIDRLRADARRGRHGRRDELDAIDARGSAARSRRPTASPRRAPWPDPATAATHVYAEPRRATRAAAAAATGSITLFAGDARSTRRGDGREPDDLRAGRRHRQARRQLQDDRRAVRAVRPASGCATRRSASAASSAWAAGRP